MSDTPSRRLRAVPEDLAAAVDLLPDSPRVAALDALLREVDSLRLSLETDLGAAADAVACGDVSRAHDLIDNDLDELHSFEDRALGHVSALAFGPTTARARRRWWTYVPAAPFVAAAAVVGFLVGVVPNALAPVPDDSTISTVSATSSLGRLSQLAAEGAPTSQIEAASDRLHAQLAPLIAEARTNPVVAQQVLAWLNAERAALQSRGDSSAIAALVRQSQALTRSVTAALPAAVRVSVPPTAVPVRVAVPTPAPTKAPAKASPKPSQAPPKATRSPSASPSTSPSKDPVLPADAGLTD